MFTQRFRFVQVHQERKEELISHPAQRRGKDVVKTSYFWSQRRGNGSLDGLVLPRQEVFQEMS